MYLACFVNLNDIYAMYVHFTYVKRKNVLSGERNCPGKLFKGNCLGEYVEENVRRSSWIRVLVQINKCFATH